MVSRMRMGVLSVAVVVGLMGQVGVGQQPENAPPKPDFDVRSGRAPAAPSARATSEMARRRAGRESAARRVHPHTGALRVIDAPGVIVSPNATATELLTALGDLTERLGLDDDDLGSVEMVRDYASASTGLRHVTFAQMLDGLPVFGGVVTLHIATSGATSGAAAGSIVRVNSSAARGSGRSRRAAVTADAAVVAAAADVSPNTPFAAVRLDPGNASTARFARGRFPRDIASALEWFPMDGGVRLA